MVHHSCTIAQNLVVNYHLVVSYLHQYHIGIKVDYWYVIIIEIHIMLLFGFFRAKLWIVFISYSHNCDDKQINCTHMQNYVKTSRYFYRKLYYDFFKCKKKWIETCRNLNLINSRRLFFGDAINETFIL